jgi:hypothetical protein
MSRLCNLELKATDVTIKKEVQRAHYRVVGWIRGKVDVETAWQNFLKAEPANVKSTSSRVEIAREVLTTSGFLTLVDLVFEENTIDLLEAKTFHELKEANETLETTADWNVGGKGHLLAMQDNFTQKRMVQHLFSKGVMGNQFLSVIRLIQDFHMSPSTPASTPLVRKLFDTIHASCGVDAAVFDERHKHDFGGGKSDDDDLYIRLSWTNLAIVMRAVSTLSDTRITIHLWVRAHDRYYHGVLNKDPDIFIDFFEELVETTRDGEEFMLAAIMERGVCVEDEGVSSIHLWSEDHDRRLAPMVVVESLTVKGGWTHNITTAAKTIKLTTKRKAKK